MDSKKTNLTPELKEIYDRVMNTQSAKDKPTPTPIAPPSTTPPPLPPTNTPPLAPPMPHVPPQAVPSPAQSAQTIPSVQTPAEDALTSSPARPVSEGNTFSFSGTVHNAPVDQKIKDKKGEVTGEKKKARLSLPILIALGIVFLIVWCVFWAVIFGFIKR